MHVSVGLMFNSGLPFPSTARLAKCFWCRQTIASWHRSSHQHPTCPGYLLNESSYLGQLESGCECGSDVNRYIFFFFFFPLMMMVMFPPPQHNGSHSSALLLGMLALF